MVDINVIKLLVRYTKKGQIDKAYSSMFKEADRLSALETKELLEHIGATLPDMDVITAINKLYNHKKERLEFHMNEMKKLLEMSLKAQSKEK